MGNLGLPELLVILGIVLLVGGASKLPQIARSMGQSIREFKKGMQDGSSEPSNKA